MTRAIYVVLDGRMRKLPKWLANLPTEHKKVRWPWANKTVLMGQKARNSHQAFSIARGQYPVYCQRIGRRVYEPVLCNNENRLAAAISGLDWRVDHVIIRKDHGAPPSPDPERTYYLPGKKAQPPAARATFKQKLARLRIVTTRAA